MFAGVPGNPRRCPRALLWAGVLLAALTPVSARAQTGGGDCTPSPTTLCLFDDRFQVEVEWHDFSGNPLRLPGTPGSGDGHAEELPASAAPDTGYFWFFDANNVDLVVSVLDGRQINGHFWIFAAALTNVEYTIRVVDTQTGTPNTYFNPPGHLTVVTDTNAFADDSNKAASRALGLSGDPGPAVSRAVFLPKEALPSCDDPEVACVQGGRFAVHADYTPPGPGFPPMIAPEIVLETATSALIELFGNGTVPFLGARVIDGRAIDGRFWIFATATSTVPGLTVTVTDLETRQAVTYAANGAGLLAVAENDPFAPDPPSNQWLTTPAIPGFRFQVRVTGGGEIPTRQEADCIPETLCISGAVPGRSELFVRIVGPKPNGFLWPNIVKFSTSQIEVWIEQTSTGQVNYYKLDGVGPASNELTGFFDRRGFAPLN